MKERSKATHALSGRSGRCPRGGVVPSEHPTRHAFARSFWRPVRGPLRRRSLVCLQRHCRCVCGQCRIPNLTSSYPMELTTIHCAYGARFRATTRWLWSACPQGCRSSLVAPFLGHRMGLWTRFEFPAQVPSSGVIPVIPVTPDSCISGSSGKSSGLRPPGSSLMRKRTSLCESENRRASS